jgi:hypothetical protein
MKDLLRAQRRSPNLLVVHRPGDARANDPTSPGVV